MKPMLPRRRLSSRSREGAARRRRQFVLESLEERVVLSLTPQMILDINTNSLSANVSNIVAIGSTAYFVADDGIHGRELWKSDGTAGGTALVKDIFPGRANYDPSPRELINVNGTLYFVADDGVRGAELWKSDGTAAGTVIVKDLVAGTDGSGPVELTNVNGMVFFVFAGGQLGRSDGTAAGTSLVKNFNTYYGVVSNTLTNVNGTLYFAADDGTRGVELWKSDGTTSGTVLVKNINPGSASGYAFSSWPRELTAVNGILFFTAQTQTNGRELWRSDGTSAGTTLVKDIRPGIDVFSNDQPFSGDPLHLTNVGGTLYFTADDGTNGRELWKSNGTSAGTVLVKDIYTGLINSSTPSNLAEVNGTLFFTALDLANGQALWKSDGTAGGTVLVKKTHPEIFWAGLHSFTNVGGTLYFTNDGSEGSELWKSDGTSPGTVLVKDVNPKSRSGGKLALLTNVNGTLMFAADDGRKGFELWRSDGTAAGTSLVKDINSTTRSSNPGPMMAVGDTVYFSADDGEHGWELWKSDGTAAGTTLVKDIFPGGFAGYYGNTYPRSSHPTPLAVVGKLLYFSAESDLAPYNWRTLWRTDGTAAGTVQVSLAALNPSGLTVLNGTLYFSADGLDGRELWKSDGTAGGTTLVKDIYPGTTPYYYSGYFGGWWIDRINSSSPSDLTNLNGTLFFTASDESGGRELWKSDGTAAGTVRVKDIFPGSSGSQPSELTVVNGTLFFNAWNNGYKLWKSDGTAAGTTLVKDILPGGSSNPRDLTNLNGTLIFTADDGTNGVELWKSDGTAAGTVLLRNIHPGSSSSHPDLNSSTSSWGTKDAAILNGILYFTAFDGTNGRELWRTDGTPAGTFLVKDVTPGGASSWAMDLAVARGKLFFTADDGSNALKLWQSDGTATGTVPVTTFAASRLTNVNGTLLFVADDGIHGQELWTLVDDSAPPPPPTLSIGDVTVMEGNSGTRSATFTVTLSAASSQTITVGYATVNGTATAPSDIRAATGTLTFAPGETTKTIAILVKGDRRGEPDESFVVTLSAATNATIADGEGLGTILNDEPRISINDVSRLEGNSGMIGFEFTVSLSAAYDETVSMSFQTLNGTAKATSGDYLAQTGTLSFAAGQTSSKITIYVLGDRLKEADELFSVKLSGKSTNSLFFRNTGEGRILNDD
jgi:ELWxxDGT repeat protein